MGHRAPPLDLASLRALYAGGSTPSGLVRALHPAWREQEGAFTALAPLEGLLARCRDLEALPAGQRGPLWGAPFALKDNVDAAGFPTTAACPAFAYSPARTAPAVQALLDAGAVLVGKTNMDQFAAGLVGTRSPYGTPVNPFDARFVPGGSSSGSGALVGARLVAFAIGTDTAGSGRIPAAFCGCVGLKPTVGRVSTEGVVPACKSLDCLSIFAWSVEDASAVLRLMEGTPDRLADPTCRPLPSDDLSAAPQGGSPSHEGPGTPPAAPLANGFHAAPEQNGHSQPAAAAAAGAGAAAQPAFRFAVPSAKHLSFAGPGGRRAEHCYAALFEEAVARLARLGGQQVAAFDFGPFAATARLLYESAFLAERYAGLAAFLEGPGGGPPRREALAADPRLERVTAAILAGGLDFRGADVYAGLERLSQLQAAARVQLRGVDVLLVPSAAHHYLVAEVEAEEKLGEGVAWPKNANLGRFTNFVNLLDLAALALPSGVARLPAAAPAEPFDSDEERRRAELLAETHGPAPALPWGVTLIGSAWSDGRLAALGARYLADTGLGCGPEGHGVAPKQATAQ